MERGKMSSTGRGGKSKAPQHPQDIFALGSKSTVAVSRDSEKRNIHKPSTSGVERKREPPSFGPPPPSKKSRIGSPAESVTGMSLEIDPVDLVPNVLQALDTHNSDKLLGLLTGSIRLLKSQRAKPDPILCMSMLYLVKIRPNMFAHETVTQSLCSLLKREQGAAFKNKGNLLVFVVACNMLYAAHKDSKNWPDIFIKVYIEDGVNERWWVQCAWCKCFVENIVTAFNTKPPPPHLIPTDAALVAGTMSPVGAGSPLPGGADDDTDVSELEYDVYPRYSGSYESVEALVLEAIRDLLQRRAAPDAIGKGFLKLLTATCGFPEIRMVSAARLEGWLHSGKLWRAAQELLAALCVNADASPRDHEVLAQLARMRLKTKPLVAAYVACLKEMVSRSSALVRSVMTHTVYNELSAVRSPHNLQVLGALLQCVPVHAPHALADTLHELLHRPEEYVRPLRLLLRECVRGARGDAAALLPLARALAAPRAAPPPEVRERAFASTVELFCTISLIVATHSRHAPELRAQLSAAQAAAVGWLCDAVPLYAPGKADFMLALNKIMFMESAESYSKLDNWPPESERAATHRLCCEAPLLQHTLARVIYIGLSKELPVSPTEVFELVFQLVGRACALPAEEPAPPAPPELAPAVLQLAERAARETRHKQLSAASAGAASAATAAAAAAAAAGTLHWRAWLLLLLASATDSELAERAAQQYPTLRGLIEYCITNKPSLEWRGNGAEIDFSQTPITETTDTALTPPPAVLAQLEALSGSLRLRRLLCRAPALLLACVQRHGTRLALPWLQELLLDQQLELSVLPVQCLCEFLSAGGAGGSRAGSLAAHLRRSLGTPDGARAVLGHYLSRVAHRAAAVRQAAARGLKFVLTETFEDADLDTNAEVDPEEWLSALWDTPHWEAIRPLAVSLLLAACQTECAPRPLAAYIRFLARYARTDGAQLDNVVLELSQVLMERMSVMAAVLPGAAEPRATVYHLTLIFYTHLQQLFLHEPPPEEEEGAAGGERVQLSWGARSRRVPLVLPHAHLELLCYTPSPLDENHTMYNFLLNTWLGPDSPLASAPAALEALLLPDWLRLHLVRSARAPLLAAGLRGLPAHKLALFVQTFGMPVPAMSAMLSALDACSMGSVSRLGVERGYMAQLLQVQRARGAVGGAAFAAALGLAPPQPPPEDTLFSSPPPLPAAPAPPARAAAPLAPAQVPALLAAVFGPADADVDAGFTELCTNIQREANLPAGADTPHTAAALAALGARGLAPGLLRRQHHAAALLHLLRLAQPRAAQELSSRLVPLLKCPVGPLAALLRAPRAAAPALPPVPPRASRDQLLHALESSTSATLEPLGALLIRSQDTALLSDVMSQILEQSAQYENTIKAEEGVETEPHVFSRAGRGCHLLLDWLCGLQQETSDRQMRLMFCDNKAPWRSLLVAQLARRASWRTLHRVLATLLEPGGSWSPPAVLQFADTLTRGERPSGARERPGADRALALSHQQIRSIVQYIIREGAAAAAGAGEAAGAEGARRVMSRRLALLLRACPTDADRLCAAAAAARSPDPGPLLLALIYMQVPKVRQLLADCELQGPGPRVRAELAGDVPAATDRAAHCLMTAAPRHDAHKQERLSHVLAALGRRHGFAAGRALRLAAALGRGTRAQPPPIQLFHPDYQSDLEDILSSCMSAAASGPAPGARVAALVRLCAERGGGKLLAQYRDVIASRGALSGAASGAGSASATPPPHALLAVRRALDQDELKAAVQELEGWTGRRGALGASEARSAAALLVLPRAPRAAVVALLARALPLLEDTTPGLLAILSALDSGQPEAAAAALERLGDLLAGMLEHAHDIVMRAFELGMKGALSVDAAVAKCVATLNLLKGC